MDSTNETGPVEARLMDLIDRGYRFMHPRDPDGSLLAVVGVRPHGNVVDIVRLDAENDATALRVPADEADPLTPSRVLWQCQGAADRVLDQLLGLPDDALTIPSVA